MPNFYPAAAGAGTGSRSVTEELIAHLRRDRPRMVAGELVFLNGPETADEAGEYYAEQAKAQKRARRDAGPDNTAVASESRPLESSDALAAVDSCKAASSVAEPEAVGHSPSSARKSPLAADPRVVPSPTAAAKTLRADEEAKRVRMAKLEAQKASASPAVVERKSILFSSSTLFDSANLVAAAAARKERLAAMKKDSVACVYAASIRYTVDCIILINPRNFMNCPLSVFDLSSVLNLAGALSEIDPVFPIFPFFISAEDTAKLNKMAAVNIMGHTLSLGHNKDAHRQRFAFLRELVISFHSTHIKSMEAQTITPVKLNEMKEKISYAFSAIMDFINDNEAAALKYLTEFKRVATFIDKDGIVALSRDVDAVNAATEATSAATKAMH